MPEGKKVPKEMSPTFIATLLFEEFVDFSRGTRGWEAEQSFRQHYVTGNKQKFEYMAHKEGTLVNTPDPQSELMEDYILEYM